MLRTRWADRGAKSSGGYTPDKCMALRRSVGTLALIRSAIVPSSSLPRHLQEAAVQQTVAAQQAQPVVVVRPPSVPESWRVAQPGLSSGLLGLAALVAGAHLARTRLKDARRIPGVAELGRVLRWTVHTLAGATALANRALLRAVLHALEAQPDSPPPQQRRRPATALASSPAPGSPLVDEQSEYGNAAAALAARQVAAEEAAYLAAMAAAVAPASPAPAASPKPARRLSEDELQQRIAVMKGEVSPRTPVPQVGAEVASGVGAPLSCLLLACAMMPVRLCFCAGCFQCWPAAVSLFVDQAHPFFFLPACSALPRASCRWGCQSPPMATASLAASMVSAKRYTDPPWRGRLLPAICLCLPATGSLPLLCLPVAFCSPPQLPSLLQTHTQWNQAPTTACPPCPHAGTYYGGRQVRDSVKEYLDGGAGPGSRPANTPARRMEVCARLAPPAAGLLHAAWRVA